MSSISDLYEAIKSSIKKDFVSKEVKDTRMSLCKSCDNYMGGICKMCYCNMEFKTSIPTMECPIKKWVAVDGTEK